MTQMQARPLVSEVLKNLKDFQQVTVDYVFQRLYKDSDRVSRFLIADEVGLGKTLVARGVIAKAVDHLWKRKKRIDVIYICSNQEIARQNINRLNITDERTFTHASRATLLPVRTHQLQQNKLNFISLTPGTSFNLRSSTGIIEERALLYFLLKDAWRGFDADILSNILRVDVRQDRWDWNLEWFSQNEKIDQELAMVFRKALKASGMRKEFDGLADAFGHRKKSVPETARRHRRYIVGQLRRLLARSSLQHLEPDLIILDEFQRFKVLLDDNSEIGELANELFQYEDAKVILLSATPYKMYTVYGENDDNHYEDFKSTVKFLLDGADQETDRLFEAITQFRRAFLWATTDPSSQTQLALFKAQMENTLRRVMVRTEKLAVSQDRNGMLQEFLVGQEDMKPSDLVSFVYLDRIAREINADDQVEYWKSSAYPLNLMEDYKLKRQFEQARKSKDSDALKAMIQQAQPYLMKWADIESYRSIDLANARLRALSHRSIESNNWKCLWLPPSLPYYLPEGPFQEIDASGSTKTLVFSAWRVVPKVISVLLSYEAERLMLQESKRDFAYSELSRKKPRLLEFSSNQDRLTGMSVFTSLYPCLTLAQKIDPLAISKRTNANSAPSRFYAFLTAHLQIKSLLNEACTQVHIRDTGPVDERWYWLAPVLLDRHFQRNEIWQFLSPQNADQSWDRLLLAEAEEGQQTRFTEHVNLVKTCWAQPPELGRQPDNLVDILTLVAMAGPATCILRSLLRTLNISAPFAPAVRCAADAAFGFRTLFNQPDSISLLQTLYEDKDYWQAVLEYCAQGNIQAMLDEYFHILNESLGLIGNPQEKAATEISRELRRALSLRAPSLRFDDINANEDKISLDHSHGVRCRYALRFGNDKGDGEEKITRDVDVRAAFNSPFRPFVLSTTSLGQEGLDFHQYCHRIMHWNLPTNPVDLEQREGRIHRYKGHVIRRNIATTYGYQSIEIDQDGLTDPWKQMFGKATQDRDKSSNDLTPFWIYEGGGFKIERLIPVLPLSSEINRLKYLKRTLVAYRSVIGQPRQQELLESLSSRFTPEELGELARKFSIDLSPPPLEKEQHNL